MKLIDELIQSGYLKSPEIINAFKKIKREDFLLPNDKTLSEVNAPISIGHGQTISQPLTVAFMLELLQAKKNDKVLDVGSGSGWTCALLAEIVGNNGKVYGVERILNLKNFAENNISKYNFMLLPSATRATNAGHTNKGIVQLFCTDGYQGLKEFSPYDKIIVAAAAEEVPKELLKQLVVGGRMVIPIGQQFQSQEIIMVEKLSENNYKEKRYPGFIFVPLVKCH
ncbi:MAG: protein-L-isoaspartate O-methyltransferase [Patescibacteria group bacterium]